MFPLRRIGLGGLWWLAILGMAGCHLPAATPTALPPEAVFTAVAETLTAQPPIFVSAPAPSPSPTPAAPSVTPPASPTSPPTATATPSVPVVQVTVNTNCRTGPGKNYPRVGTLTVGEVAQILARDPSGQFWYIPNPDRPGEFCWIWGQYAQPAGDLSRIPIFTPPPLPADAVVTFAGVEQCMDGVHMSIRVENTGGVTWESYVADYADLTVPNGFTTFPTYAFYDNRGCVSHQVIDDLAPGEAGYIQFVLTGAIIAPGHRVRVTVQLSDRDEPGGTVITRQVEFTFPVP